MLQPIQVSSLFETDSEMNLTLQNGTELGTTTKYVNQITKSQFILANVVEYNNRLDGKYK